MAAIEDNSKNSVAQIREKRGLPIPEGPWKSLINIMIIKMIIIIIENM